MVARWLALALLAGALAGCVSLSPEDAAHDRTLKQFGTKPDVAGLYVYCDEIMGPTPRVNVFVDDQPLGQLSAPQYFYTALAPGLHRVRVESANVSTVDFDAEAGHNYYAWSEMTLGFWMSGVRLHLMPEREGKVGVMGTAYVPPSHRAIDLQAARRAEIAWAVVGQLIGALPALGGGAIRPFAPGL